MNKPTLFYVHDPMCSWCWGYRPVWLSLKSSLASEVVVENVLGGLAPDSDRLMPAELQAAIKGHWSRIQAMLGTRFNFEFWDRNQPRRDTYKACRAVIAAGKQGAEELMTEAIQRAYYLRAMNPSDFPVLQQLSHEIGLDSRQFSEDLHAPETQQTLFDQLALRDDLGVNSYPSLVLQINGSIVPIGVNYHDAGPTLQKIHKACHS